MADGFDVQRSAQCSLCQSARADADPLAALAWVCENDEQGGQNWLCPSCARRHVRDIEGKLPAEYW